MSELLRIELTGKNAEAWNRVFGSLTGLLESAVRKVCCRINPDAEGEAASLATDIAEITKSWVRAKLENPSIENESKLAEIAERFERMKLLQIDQKRGMVALEKEKLELFEKQVQTALRLLKVLHSCVVRDEQGNVTVLLTNKILANLKVEVAASAREGAT